MSTRKVTQIERAAKDGILNNLCDQIDQKKKDSNLSVNDRIPRGFVSSLVVGYKNVAPWVTRNAINNCYCKRAKMGIYSCKLSATSTATGAEDVAPVTIHIAVTPERVKGGRPEGTTDKRKYNNSKAAISSKNEIVDIYFTEKKAAGKKRLKRGRLDEIIAEVKETNKLTDNIVINKALIRQRVK